MPTKATTPGDTPGPPTCDASGMAMIHRLYRRHFGEAPALVRSVRPDDKRHTDAVADHLALLSTSLHRHHEGEDERLWRTVESRQPACAIHVERMKQHHAQMLTHLIALDDALPEWRAGETGPESVLSALDGVNAALAVHLDDEVATIVPVIETTMTQAEVDWFGEHGRKGTPKGKTWATIGLMLEAQPDGGAHVLAQEFPAPFRLAWRLLGQRSYEKYRAQLAGPTAA